jgi:hypothetical protein
MLASTIDPAAGAEGDADQTHLPFEDRARSHCSSLS